MKLYQIYYPNSNITQVKVMISHDLYLCSKLLCECCQKQYLKKLSGGYEWFTDSSAYYKAITTDILKHYGGDSPVTITEIK